MNNFPSLPIASTSSELPSHANIAVNIPQSSFVYVAKICAVVIAFFANEDPHKTASIIIAVTNSL